MAKTKIVVAGIGGVGGFFGGLLARHYYKSDDVAIHFVARGEHLKEIRANGLAVVKGDTRFVAMPESATGDPATIGIADYIIVGTKSYDLESVMEQLRPCINAETVILPLLNGVDSKERIKSMLPDNPVLDGCVYIVARIIEPGVVENSGNIQTLYLGAEDVNGERQEVLGHIFREAGIEATCTPDILRVIWEKYIFISPIATATTFYDTTIGAIVADKEKFATVRALIEEVKQLAQAKQIDISEDITEKTINKLKSMPFEATSSMHRDFIAGKAKNELKSLTGFVVHMNPVYKIDTSVYKQLYEQLSAR